MKLEHVLRLSAVSALLALAPPAARLAADEVPFVRGDYNQDGAVSFADGLALKRWLFNGEMAPACWNAGDANDEGRLDISDVIFLMLATITVPGWEMTLPPPCPEAGPDMTPNLDPWVSCESYVPEPAEATTDIIRIGEVEGAPGTQVKIPVYISTAIPVEAVQLVLAYDPDVIGFVEDPERIDHALPLSWEGTYYEQNFFGKTFTIRQAPGMEPKPYAYTPSDQNPCIFHGTHPDHRIFTAAFGGHLIYTEFEIPPGDDILVAWINVTISPEAEPGTVVDIVPTNGTDGAGIGPFGLKNELIYRGAARYASILPQTVPGKVGVIGDITFFSRGDANGDCSVDVSDPIGILGHLFLGGPPPVCFGAADADGSRYLDISDPIAILDHLFLGGEWPAGKVACGS